MGRNKRIPDDAKGTTVYLTPDDRVALTLIVERRSKKHDARGSQNEVMVDAIWRVLEEEEGITREDLAKLLSVEPAALQPTNVTEIRKKPK